MECDIVVLFVTKAACLRASRHCYYYENGMSRLWVRVLIVYDMKMFMNNQTM